MLKIADLDMKKARSVEMVTDAGLLDVNIIMEIVMFRLLFYPTATATGDLHNIPSNITESGIRIVLGITITETGTKSSLSFGTERKTFLNFQGDIGRSGARTCNQAITT